MDTSTTRRKRRKHPKPKTWKATKPAIASVEAVLAGIRHRKDSLTRTLEALRHREGPKLTFIEMDTEARIDELESLFDYISGRAQDA